MQSFYLESAKFFTKAHFLRKCAMFLWAVGFQDDMLILWNPMIMIINAVQNF